MSIDSYAGQSIARARTRPRWIWALGGLLFAAAIGSAVPASAQDSGKGFLFGEPTGTLTLRGGFAHANAGSDIFRFTTNQLTLDRGDFSGPAFGADLAFRIASRVDLVLGTAYAGMSKRSEFRKFVDQNDLPIEQTTSFRRVPVTASVKAYLTPRGRSIGQYAWIPARYALYVGAGGGAMWYSFRQRGYFVDPSSSNVFSDTYESSKWTPMAHAMAGIDYSLSNHFGLTGEGRYSWAKADLSSDFAGFRPIDLSGVSATLGLYVRF